MHEKPIVHADFFIFWGADVIKHKKRKNVKTPTGKISTYISKVAIERGEKDVFWNSDIREFRRDQEDY